MLHPPNGGAPQLAQPANICSYELVLPHQVLDKL
jgi:hypothetical protein